MKKTAVILFCFVAVIMIASLSVSAQSDAVHADELLTRLGILTDEEIKNDAVVTRAEFAQFAVRLTETSPQSSAKEPEFTDVAKSDWAYADISTAYSLGLIGGYEDGSFRPNDPIMLSEAMVIMLRVLGYGECISSFTNADILKLAKRIDLIDGISLEASIPPERDEVFLLLYNALHTNVAEISEIKNGGVFGIDNDSGITLLEKYFDVVYTEGVVEATQNSAVDNKKTAKGLVRIAGITIKDTMRISDAVFGCNVRCYYKKDAQTSIVYIYEKNNSITTFRLADGQYSHMCFTVTENGKSHKYVINSKTTVFINGSIATNDKDINDSFSAYGGTVRLIDSNRNSVYDTVIIERYKNIIVESFNAETTLLCARAESFGSVTPDEYVNWRVLDSFGEEAAAEEIKTDTLVSVFLPLTKDEELKIVLGGEALTMKITAINSENENLQSEEMSMRICSSNAIELSEITLGETYTIYTDFSGEVAFAELKLSRMEFVYVISAGKKNGLSSDMEMKCFSKEGHMQIYTTADKVLFRGADGELMNTKISGASLFTLLEADGITKKFPAMIRLSDDKHVSELWLLTDDEKKPFHRLTDDLKQTALFEYRPNNFMGKYVAKKETVYMLVPLNESACDEDYKISGSGLFVNGVSYRLNYSETYPRMSVTMISLEENGFITDICLTAIDFDQAPTLREAVEPVIYTKCRYGTNEAGEDVCFITVTDDSGVESVFEYIDDGNGVFDRKNEIAPRFGDIIRVSTDERGKISASTLQVMYCCDDNRYITYITGTTRRYLSAVRIMPVYSVLARQDDFIKINSFGYSLNENDSNGINTTEIVDISGASVFTYNKTTNKLSKMDNNAVTTGVYSDNVLMYTATGRAKMIIYYED